MKNPFTFLFMLFTGILLGQETILSGEFDFGLRLAYNPDTKKLTGYFEEATGYNDQFSCIFYIEGTLTGKQFRIRTYYPNDKSDDMIEGTIDILNLKSIKIKLDEEHGGCWNVQHFADGPVDFELVKETSWIRIGYVIADKTYFFKEKEEGKKSKSYLVKGDFVCVEKIENEWAYCSYFGKKITKGWMKIKDLNQP